MKRQRLQVAEDAEREIREAREWWHANRRDARGAFRVDLRRALDLAHPVAEVLHQPVAEMDQLAQLLCRRVC